MKSEIVNIPKTAKIEKIVVKIQRECKGRTIRGLLRDSLGCPYTC